MTFLLYIILYVSEVQPPVIHWIDILTAIWIISYTFRDIGTGILVKLRFNITPSKHKCLYLCKFKISIIYFFHFSNFSLEIGGRKTDSRPSIPKTLPHILAYVQFVCRLLLPHRIIIKAVGNPD